VTVTDVCADLIRDPVRRLFRRWHWKSAVLSAVIRGAVFLTTNLTHGARAASLATLVELVLIVPTAGLMAAATQAFQMAEPRWAALLVTAAVLPATTQAVELAVHWAMGTPKLWTSIMASTSLSALSTLFTLFAMRRGVLIVGDDSRPLGRDVGQLPRLLVEFVLAPVRALSS
jgi:hypothetical protein